MQIPVTPARPAHPYRRSRPRHRWIAALAVAVIGGVLVPASAAAGEETLDPVDVAPGGFVKLPGTGTVSVDGEPVPKKIVLTTSSGDSELAVQVDPGVHTAELVTPAGRVVRRSFRVPKANLRSGEAVPGRVLVRVGDGVAIDKVRRPGDTFSPLGVRSDRTGGHWYAVQVPKGTEADRVRHYAADPRVEVAENDGVNQFGWSTNDSRQGEQWNIRRARTLSAWEVPDARASVPIAIVDTGVWTGHEDVRVIEQYSSSPAGSGACGSHGTAVASVAAAVADNLVGIAGSAWNGRVGNFKALGEYNPVFNEDCTYSHDSYTAQAIQAAADRGYRVINMSFTNRKAGDFSGALRDAVDTARARGVNLVGNAGNDGSSAMYYPAAFGNVVAVGATTSTDRRAGFSNYGSWVDIVAPGVNIPVATASTATSYETRDGTSFAAPLVAGVLAMYRTWLGANDAELRLQRGPLVTWDDGLQYRLLDAYGGLAFGSNCIRDVPIGSWVVWGNSTYSIQPGRVARIVYDSPWATWSSPVSDRVRICDAQWQRMTVGAPWGFRPGSLVSDGSSLWFITTDGPDRGLPIRRRVVDNATRTCMGWGSRRVFSDSSNVLPAHPVGPVIDTLTCGQGRGP